MTTDLHTRWFPIAASTDLTPRHVFQGKLLGREFAVRRADDGFVNVWENRCLHRGVRLSIGINDGRELKCQYHGWRYSNRTAGCTYIPAHPADAPARTISNNVYPAREALGLIWVGEQASGDIAAPEGFADATVLRAIPLNAPRDMVIEALRGYRFGEGCAGVLNDDGSVTAADGAAVRLWVQLIDSNHSAIRGLANTAPKGAARMALLRQPNAGLQALRERVEALAARTPAAPPMQPKIAKVSDDLVDVPPASKEGRTTDLRVRVARKVMTATDVVSLRFEPVRGLLPTFQAGAHIDVHLQNGLIRQYSLTNGPGETDHYTIGVKREPHSTGGSLAIHDTVAEGDVLAISAPRSNFPLRRDAERTIFVAGGIGVTPLLAMARALNAMAMPFEFHYFVQSQDHAAFQPEMTAFGNALTLHKGLSPDTTGDQLRAVLANPGFARHVYLCGPGPMLEAARAIATDQGWADAAVHFEYFKNTKKVDHSTAFQIDLARSAMTLTVPEGRTILEVLRNNGITMGSSCERGACGTCRSGVIAGAINHQDVYLSDAEKAEGRPIMTCVSRAAGYRLTLDI